MLTRFVYFVTLAIWASCLFAQGQVSNSDLFYKETINSLGNGQFVHLVKRYKIVAGVEHIIDDSVQWDVARYDSLFNLIEGPQFNYPGIDIDKSSWIFGDTLSSFNKKVMLTFKLDKVRNPVGYLVLPGIKVILPIDFSGDGVSFVEDVPKGTIAKAIVIDRMTSQYTVATALFITGDRNVIELRAFPASKLEIQKALNRFNY